MFSLKIDIIEALKQAGYSTYRIRKEKIIGEGAMQKFRNGGLPSWNELEIICTLTGLRFDEIIQQDAT